jgi:3D (Asp-Asp-Asp) domain-containing protein
VKFKVNCSVFRSHEKRNRTEHLLNATAVLCFLSSVFLAHGATEGQKPSLSVSAQEEEGGTQPSLSEIQTKTYASAAEGKPAVESANYTEWQTVRMRVTAYCPCAKCCGEYSDGITACGHKIQAGDTFAAADKRYPFGTEMIIAGYNHGEPIKVLDRGGAIRGNRLDVFFHTHKEALQWGVRHLDVKVRLK